MSSVSQSKNGVEDFDTGQRGGVAEAGLSGRPGELQDGHSRPRLRTSLFNQDSVLAEEAQSANLLTENMGPSRLREKGLADTALSESMRTITADSAEPLSRSADATANGGDQGSAPRESGGCAPVGGSTERREVPAGGLDNSSSGSGTFRSSSRALGLQHSVSGKKRALWQIDLSEVDLGELIASGSFGSVHRGHYGGREVAIKLLHIPESSSDKEKRAALHAFKQEVSVWHALHHPNIVEFIGASMEAKQWAIVTEYIAGGSLKSFTAQRQGKKLPLQQAVNMALDVARGMAYLHNKDILHRDLKSANLLIDPSYRVKVADFGLARQEAADPGDMTCETGTIRWMAPEVIDHRPYTRKVDVYSFSIVAWEIFSMKLPFEGFSFVQLAHAVVASNARPPLAGIPKPLADILERCWDPVPERRPDFNTVVKWLEDVLDSGVSDLKDAETAGCCACILL